MAGIPGIDTGSTVGTDAGAIAASAMGVNPSNDPNAGFFSTVLYNALNHAPTMKQSMGYTGFRMSNSILYGGFRPEAAPVGSVRGFLRNNLTPRSLTRFADPDQMLRSARTGKGYSPYNIAAFTNPRVAKVEETRSAATNARRLEVMADSSLDDTQRAKLMREAGQFGDDAVRDMRGGKVFAKPLNWASKHGIAQPGVDFMEGGILGKTMAGMRLSNMDMVSQTRWGARLAGKGGKGVLEKYAAQGLSGRAAASHYMANAFTSTVGAKMGGYVAGARLGQTAVTEGVKRTISAGGTGAGAKIGTTFAQSAGKAMSHFAGGGVVVDQVTGRLVHEAAETGIKKVGIRAGAAGMRTAAKAGVVTGAKYAGAAAARVVGATLANPFVGAAMAAWTVWDIGKMIGGIGKAAIDRGMRFQKEKMTSMKGQIEKPVFGMGFTDNEVGASARSRGVMAIQNSRLNARSVLGNEAGPIASHFG